MGKRKGSKNLESESAIALKWYHEFIKKRTLLLILLPISLFLIWLVKQNSWIGENIFARGIYIPVSKVISIVTGIFPFSIMIVEIVVIIFTVIVIGIVFIKKLINRVRSHNNIIFFITISILNVACVVSCVYFFYTVVCGVNYHRYSFAQIANLQVEDSSVQDLYDLSMSLSEKAGKLRASLNQTEGSITDNGLVKVNRSGWKDVSNTANETYKKISSKYPELGGNYKSLKTVYFSEFMSRMETTGIFWPFTMEANVNIDVPEFSIPATMCHELAHQRGFMREDEANFIAYLVCKNSDSLLFQYSGVMLALTYAGNRLYSENPELYKQLRATYTDDMNLDFRQEYYYWVKFEDTVISTVSNTLNDSYLKANSQEDGVKSYGRMVDLLIAEHKKELK